MNNSPNINVATRVQQGGTCWFHAIVNGLIMSYRSRKYLKQSINSKGITNNNLGVGGCPRTIDGFWKYIAYRLKEPKTISPRIRNVNVIKASGARRRVANPLGFIPRRGNTKSNYTRRIALSRSSVTGGTISDLYNIYTKLFGKDFSNNTRSTPIFVIRKGNDFQKVILNNKGVEYALSHSYIALNGRGGLFGHAIAGYISRNNAYRIFDSGWNVAHSFDWSVSDGDKHLLDWYNKEYMPYGLKLTSMKKWAVYVRMDKI